MRFLLALFLLLAVAIPGCSRSADPLPANDAPELLLLDLDGNRGELWQSGAAATVAWFARSDCPISNRYAPQLRQLYERFYPQGVEFFLIYVDPQEQPQAIRQHLEEFNYPCLALRDPYHTLVAATGAEVTPEVVVFDGTRRQRYRGRVDDLYVNFGIARDQASTHELADALKAILAGEEVAVAQTEAIGCYIGDLK